MNKNFNLENAKSIIAEASGVPVNTTFGSITKPIDLLLEVIDMSADLIALIHEETELKKHHRAYLHVHEELEDCADQMAERMQEIFDETTDCVIKLMKDVHETFRVRKQEAAEDDADTVTIAKEDYETMIDDLLKTLLFGHGGKEGVLVACFGFARKCGHQVFLALGTSILVHNILLIHSLRFIPNQSFFASVYYALFYSLIIAQF